MEEDYQKKVTEEKEALDEKLDALRVFSGTQAFHDLSTGHQTLLMQQESVMGKYSHILGDRIKLFEHEAEVEKTEKPF